MSLRGSVDDDTQHVEAPRLKLTRACRACVKAKRKCSYELPSCHRCWTRKVKCSYENEPAPPQSAGVYSRLSRRDGHNVHSLPRGKRPFARNTALPLLPSQPAFLVAPDQESLTYMINLAKRHVFMFGLFGATAFIHPALKRSQLSRNVQALSRAATSQAQLPRKQCNAIAQDIDYVFNSMLLSVGAIVHVEDMLAVVQNLLLIQIITLHVLQSGNNNDMMGTEYRQRAELRNAILAEWVDRLVQHAPSQLPHTLSRREAFLLAESVRRTIIVSRELRGLHQASQQGYYEGSMFSQSLPFERRVELWHMENDEDFERAFSQGEAGPAAQEMISWREYVELLDAGVVAERYTPFELMLLVGAKGKSAVERQLQISL